MNDEELAAYRDLTELTAPGAVLGVEGPFDTKNLFYQGDRYLPERRALHARLIARFEGRYTHVPRESRAVVTAGPPGAGKSVAMTREFGDLDQWVRIDADEFKEWLIDEMRDDPRFEGAFNTTLSNGDQVRPMELSGVVHRESTHLADLALRDALVRGQNVIIEGTLTWDGLVERYSEQLDGAEYGQVDVISVEAPQEVAQEGAVRRWLRSRLTRLGGRFTPAAAVAYSYNEDGSSKCTPVAEALVDRCRALGMQARLLLHRRESNDPAPAQDVAQLTESPEPHQARDGTEPVDSQPVDTKKASDPMQARPPSPQPRPVAQPDTNRHVDLPPSQRTDSPTLGL